MWNPFTCRSLQRLPFFVPRAVLPPYRGRIVLWVHPDLQDFIFTFLLQSKIFYRFASGFHRAKAHSGNQRG
jgi:hypothetical protein